MINLVTDIDKVNINDWATFVFDHPNGNIYQTPLFYQAINSTRLGKSYAFFALENDIIVGVLVANLQKEPGLLIGLLSSRSIISGGPIVRDNDPALAELLLAFYNSYIEKKAIYSQFRNLFATDSFKSAFQNCNFIIEDHLNILVNLDKEEDILWGEVHSKRRNEIRRAKKEGTTVEIAKSIDSIEITYAILKEVYSRAKLPLPSISYFKSIFKVLGPEIFRVFIAKNQNQVIGTMYTLCYKNTIIDWYAGSFVEHYKKFPNDLIPWEIFIWGKENGYNTFDFGGAGKPNKPYGVRDYKQKFGGELVSFGRYEKINKPFLMRISKFGFRCYQFTKKFMK